ncbi:hypothetical protein [Arenimonas alkanexedens]
MNGIFLLAVPVAAMIVHVWALLAGRRGELRVHGLAFYSGLLGLLLLPTIPATFILAGPLPVVGPVNPGFESAFYVVGALSLALAATSAILAPYVSFQRKHSVA